MKKGFVLLEGLDGQDGGDSVRSKISKLERPGLKSALKSPTREPPLTKERTEGPVVLDVDMFPAVKEFPVGGENNSASSNNKGNIHNSSATGKVEPTTADIMEELRTMMDRMVLKKDIEQLATKTDVEMMVAEAVDL